MDATWTTLDELDTGTPFRKIRPALGVEAFGINALALPEGGTGFWHFHDEQDELYFVHAGEVRFEFGEDGAETTLGPGGVVHVPSTTPRRVSNAGSGTALIVVVGAKDGYVGRDGQLVNPDDLAARQAAGSQGASTDGT